ncbi:transposase [Fictibacillus sp. KU28468]|uniref:transposase n=1 Tax=Fictibacillus sp. KU28468 TaxID=2991053 RepID=UPI00223DB965|nr:transposase [Fictibacillus sp. KU28468]UZJ78495.1 transposase [Fictibacillus sp. KU28468]
MFLLGKKHHTKEYKEYVAKLVVEEGRRITDMAYELDLTVSSISRWVKLYKEKKKSEAPDEGYVTPTELKKIKQDYEKKLRDMEVENEILKKAMHIFTKKPE